MGIGDMRGMYHTETVPFTGRAHLVVRCHAAVRSLTESHFLGFKEEHASAILPEDHEHTVRVNRILSKIINAIISAPPLASETTREPLGWAAALDWEAVVLQNDDIRARCWAAAGKIVVYTGLLNVYDTDEDIAAVLSHEVGHVIARHSSEIIQRLANWKWLPSFLLTPFFRRHEFEADYIGMILLAASGLDPQVAPRTLEKLRDMGGDYTPNNKFYHLAFSTHPSLKKRSQFLLRPNIRNKVMELYIQVKSTDQVSDKA